MQNLTRIAAPALAALLTLSACATAGRDAPLADGSDVALGQRAYVDGPLVQPVAVLEDSRCPMNARCIWAGRVKVQMVWIRGNGDKQPFEATFKCSRVAGEQRYEIVGAPAEQLPWLKSIGCFTEIISFRTRVFIPTATASPVISDLLHL